MAHEVLWFGLGGFSILLGLFFLFWFILKPIIRTNVEYGKGIVIFGYVLAAVGGFLFSRMLSMFFCFRVLIPMICNGVTVLISIVLFEFLYWRFFVYRINDYNSSSMFY